ncbi:hypothetical protein OS493_021568 [Desmophyllum pertusum]|uniref:C3H1-type domain-containing protein n=1 Tax=Desmophyllum pertusum TaxID=174260 RepID=A0A9W9YMT9_9CNID|nr:hypothetical protein OS493_021568 [Desmophyllum pertusum]
MACGHRPYCHFRHSKPGLKASKSKISPHKHNTEKERHAVIKTKTPSPEGSDKHKVQAAVTVTAPEDKTKMTQQPKILQVTAMKKNTQHQQPQLQLQ